jgi:hypothetical protein
VRILSVNGPTATLKVGARCYSEIPDMRKDDLFRVVDSTEQLVSGGSVEGFDARS